MKKTLSIAILTLQLSPALALAQPSPSYAPNMSQDQWIGFAKRAINGSAVLDKPLVFVLNATGEQIDLIMCDEKYQLVGPSPESHVKDNPHSVPAWTATIIRTDSYDGYCRKSLTAQDSQGNVYSASITSADGTFSSASFITFKSAR